MTDLLEVSGLSRSFGGLRAVDELSFTVGEGEIVSIIGPNGAGKTTAFNLISNILPPSAGAIRFRGTDLVGLPMHRISALGIARTFQNLRIFPNLTVRDNILVGLNHANKVSLAASMLRLRSHRAAEERMSDGAAALVKLVELEPVADLLARFLPYGDQRRVEIGRALATEPTLLLLDEPGAGMNPAEIDELNGLILRLRNEFGKTILLVEHHMSLVMEISDRVIVMDQGRKIAEGKPRDVQADPRVVEAYLGTQTV